MLQIIFWLWSKDPPMEGEEIEHEIKREKDK